MVFWAMLGVFGDPKMSPNPVIWTLETLVRTLIGVPSPVVTHLYLGPFPLVSPI